MAFVEDKDVEFPVLGQPGIQKIRSDFSRHEGRRPNIKRFARIDVIHKDREFLIATSILAEIFVLHITCKLILNVPGISLREDVEVPLCDAVARMVFG